MHVLRATACIAALGFALLAAPALAIDVFDDAPQLVLQDDGFANADPAWAVVPFEYDELVVACAALSPALGGEDGEDDDAAAPRACLSMPALRPGGGVGFANIV